MALGGASRYCCLDVHARAELFGSELVLLAFGILDRREAVRGRPLFDLERTCQRVADKTVVV